MRPVTCFWFCEMQENEKTVNYPKTLTRLSFKETDKAE